MKCFATLASVGLPLKLDYNLPAQLLRKLFPGLTLPNLEHTLRHSTNKTAETKFDG